MIELAESDRSGCILTDNPFQGWSSERRKRMLGFPVAPAQSIKAEEAKQVKANRDSFLMQKLKSHHI
jgi:hypothetical protein